jgi:HEAT repeats
MKVLALTCCALLFFTGSGWSQDADMDHHPFQIGAINYFGYGGLPLQKVRATLPLHVGDTLTHATFSKKPINDAVLSAIGKLPTDVNVTCCIASQQLEIFIGLPGSTSRPVPSGPVPSGNTHLDPEGLRLYEQEQPLIGQAAVRGTGSEDDSHGYMISNDPSLKAVNLAMRSYAIGRESELRQVLQTSSDPKDRRAAAALLGYVQRSSTQAEALSKAIEDPDEEVRNNAVRALAVLSAATTSDHLQINMKPLINLLYSDIWTDRNKASFLLMRMSEARNPEVLRSLRKEAMGPLVEGASWTDVPGHSTPFLVVLARIGGIPDYKLDELLKSGNTNAIISAAISSSDQAGR